MPMARARFATGHLLQFCWSQRLKWMSSPRIQEVKMFRMNQHESTILRDSPRFSYIQLCNVSSVLSCLSRRFLPHHCQARADELEKTLQKERAEHKVPDVCHCVGGRFNAPEKYHPQRGSSSQICLNTKRADVKHRPVFADKISRETIFCFDTKQKLKDLATKWVKLPEFASWGGSGTLLEAAKGMAYGLWGFPRGYLPQSTTTLGNGEAASDLSVAASHFHV